MNTPRQNPAGIDELIDSNPFNAFQVRLLLLCALVLLVEGCDYQSMALALRAMGADWGLPPASFGTVLASLSAGQAVGGILIGAASDRWGRRGAILGCFSLMAVLSFATCTASGILSLSVWRFLTGASISGIAVTSYALVADSVPARRRALCLALLFSFFSLGGFLMGFIAPILIETAGWRGIFLFGGLAPLPVIVLMYVALPDSIKVLLRRKNDPVAVRRLLDRLGITASADTIVVPHVARDGRPLAAFLSAQYRKRTLAWWGIYFCNAFVFYGLVGWLPALLADMSFSPAAAQRVSSMVWAGTFLGGLTLSVVFDKARRKQIPVIVALSLAVIALLLPQVVPADPLAWGVVLLLLGIGVGSIQLIIPVMGALIYPPSMLGAGLGMGGVVSRIGHIVVPLIGAFAIAHGAHASTYMFWLTLPVLLTLIFTVTLFQPAQRSEQGFNEFTSR